MKTRIVHTRFWSDSYIQNLKPAEKLLFIFLISNDRVNMVGAYEMNINYMQYCTGIKISDLEKIIDKLQSDRKIIFIENYVVLLNHLKYQDYSKGSERQKKAFEREKMMLPDEIIKIVDNRQDLTSYELVRNQLPTIHKSKNKKHKSKIINKKEKIKKERLEKIVDFYNEIFKKNITSTKSFERNFDVWSEIYDNEIIKKSIVAGKFDKFWCDKLTLQILFRQRNPRGEDVDLIQTLSNKSREDLKPQRVVRI